MKKVIRLTEADLINIVKRVIQEQEGGSDYVDPKTHFDTVIKSLTPKGFKENKSMAETMGVIELSKTNGHEGILVRYVSPSHPYSKKAGYVIQVIVNNKVVKSWKPGMVNMYDVIQEVEKYL